MIGTYKEVADRDMSCINCKERGRGEVRDWRVGRHPMMRKTPAEEDLYLVCNICGYLEYVVMVKMADSPVNQVEISPKYV